MSPLTQGLNYRSACDIVRRSEGRIVFSSARLCVCLFINMITHQPLEILSRNFQVIILRSKGRTSSEMVIKRL